MASALNANVSAGMPGSIDAEELTQIIVTLYEVEGRSREDGEARAEEIFKLFDEVR